MQIRRPFWFLLVQIAIMGCSGGKYILAISENTIILFVWPPKFCISFDFVFSWDHCKSQEKLETMLMQNLGDKQRVLWYFQEWPINLPPEHPIMSFETIEINMAAVSAKRSFHWAWFYLSTAVPAPCQMNRGICRPQCYVTISKSVFDWFKVKAEWKALNEGWMNGKRT